MWKVITILWNVFFIFHSVMAVAANVSVKVISGAVTVGKTLNTTQKITLGDNADCTMIGSVKSINLGQTNVSITGGTGTYYLLIQGGSIGVSEVCVGQYADYKIFKTSIDGVGISYNDSDSASASNGKPLPKEWDMIKKFDKGPTSGTSTVNIGTHITVRLWKIPSSSATLPYGTLNIEGPTISQIVGDKTGDVLSSCSGGLSHSNVYCVVNRIRPITINTSLYSSTCEFVNASKTVLMGKHHMSSSTLQGYATGWVDASFQLRCPTAYGYYSDTTNPLPSPITATKNKTVVITIHPLSGAEDAINGIIKLDGAGAKGVGIQLAWGDYSNLGTTPSSSKLVKLDTPIAGNTASSNINAGPYSTGSNAIAGDGTIKMAARYIRTGTPLQAGTANAKIEILANYQ